MDLIADRGRRVQVEELNTSKLLAHAAKQTRDKGFDDVLIIDVDAHHYENESFSEILPFMENEVLKQLAMAARSKGGRGSVLPSVPGYQDMGGRVTRYALRKTEKTQKGNVRDIELSMRWMDARWRSAAPAPTAGGNPLRAGASGTTWSAQQHQAGLAVHRHEVEQLDQMRVVQPLEELGLHRERGDAKLPQLGPGPLQDHRALVAVLLALHRQEDLGHPPDSQAPEHSKLHRSSSAAPCPRAASHPLGLHDPQGSLAECAMENSSVRVAVSLGDPSGVGPEVAAKALALPEVKRVVRGVTVADAQALVARCLELDTPEEIERIVRDELERRFNDSRPNSAPGLAAAWKIAPSRGSKIMPVRRWLFTVIL